MSITLRAARIDDITNIVPFIQMAAGGISEFLLNDLITGISAAELIEMALVDELTPYYYKNIIVAEKNREIIAASNFYPAEQHAIPDIMRSMIEQKKLDLLKPYLESRVENSMYIHTLAVADKYRVSAVGLKLAKSIETIAKENNKKCLSAHVWRDNKLVYQGLKFAGFKEVTDIPIAPHPLFKYQGGMALLKGPDFP